MAPYVNTNTLTLWFSIECHDQHADSSLVFSFTFVNVFATSYSATHSSVKHSCRSYLDFIVFAEQFFSKKINQTILIGFFCEYFLKYFIYLNETHVKDHQALNRFGITQKKSNKGKCHSRSAWYSKKITFWFHFCFWNQQNLISLIK